MDAKTITIEGKDYTLAPIKARDAKSLKNNGDAIDFTVNLVAASLIAGGDASMTAEVVGDMEYFSVYGPLSKAALEVNGLVPAGEAKAGTEAA